MRQLFNELFGNPYRKFCWPWWRHWLSYWTWVGGLKHGYQRIVQGWSYRDCWSVDSHIMTILPPMLTQLEAKSHSLWPTTKKGKRAFVQMREGFLAAQRLSDMIEPNPPYRAYYEIAGMSVEDYNAQQLRYFKNGMRVFTKYFFHLWD